MTFDEIISHNEQFFNEEFMNVWQSRNLLLIENIFVPQYIYKDTIDPKDHSIKIYTHVMKYKDHYRNKKFLDIGTCAGVNNILLTKEGFNVVGLDNDLYSLNASLYTMFLNNTHYPVYLGDHNDIEKMDYDILLVNQMDYIPDFMENLLPVLKREYQKGREAIITLLNPENGKKYKEEKDET